MGTRLITEGRGRGELYPLPLGGRSIATVARDGRGRESSRPQGTRRPLMADRRPRAPPPLVYLRWIILVLRRNPRDLVARL